MIVMLWAERGKELLIALDADPATGCSWAASFDEEFIALLKREYRQDYERIGSGGKCVFAFQLIGRRDQHHPGI